MPTTIEELNTWERDFDALIAATRTAALAEMQEQCAKVMDQKAAYYDGAPVRAALGALAESLSGECSIQAAAIRSIPLEGAPNYIRALAAAHHALTALHGLQAFDDGGDNPAPWRIDLTKTLAEIDAALGKEKADA